MKRLFRAFSILSTSFLLVSCAAQTGLKTIASPEVDSGPKVSFASPEPGVTVPFGPVQLMVLSEDARGTSQIEVLVNGITIASVPSSDSTRTSVIIEYIWQPSTDGKYVLQAHGQNTAGTWGDFASLELTVAPPTAETPGLEVVPTDTLEPTVESTDVITTPESAEETPILSDKTPTMTKNAGITLNWSFSYLRMYAYGSACEPQQNGVIVTVSGIEKSQIGSILIFFRAKNKDGITLGKWSSGLRMELFESGAYGRGFSSAHFSQPLPFIPAIMLHQFAITDPNKTVIYRSDVYQELYLAPCN